MPRINTDTETILDLWNYMHIVHGSMDEYKIIPKDFNKLVFQVYRVPNSNVSFAHFLIEIVMNHIRPANSAEQ